MDDRSSRSIVLPDGRRLAYSEYGDPDGSPTLYFHGFPGSRVEAEVAAIAARRARMRLIAADRPGIGASDAQPGRTLRDWPADVLCLAAHLRLERWAVIGVSGGAPYAAACALAIPERLDGVGIVSGIAALERPELFEGMLPFQRLVLRCAQRRPALLSLVLRPAIALRYAPRLALRSLGRILGEPDRRILSRPEVLDVLSRSLVESLRQGTAPQAAELRILATPWGFRLEDVRAPVHVWHGGRDRVVPASHGEHLCRRLARSHAHMLAGEGHFSLAIDQAFPIFAELAAARVGIDPRPRSRAEGLDE